MCSDPLVNKLKEFGYNPVRLPRADIRPLQILNRDGRELSRLGELTTILVPESGVLLPRIHMNGPAAKITVRKTGSMKTGIGISILGSFLKAMGAGAAGLDAGFQNAKNLAFEFTDVLEDHVEIARLDQYLTRSDVDPDSTFVADLLESDGIFVITSVLKSKRFTVEAGGSGSSGVKVDADAIKDLVGAGVRVSVASNDSRLVTFEGPELLVFGFQAVRLIYDNGRYTAIKPAPGVFLKSIPTGDPLSNCDVYVGSGALESFGAARAKGA